MKALDQILYWASVNYHPLYEQYLTEAYEEKNGPHFNEERARKAVDCMCHMEDSQKICGEHWSIDQVKQAVQQYKPYIKEDVTCWDAYVALNMWWHDLGRNYTRRGQDDGQLIEDAVVWSFMDEDAEDGKVWRYVNAMH